MATAGRSRLEEPRAMAGAKPNGPASAAILGAAIGVFTLGLMTTLAEAFAGLKNALVWVTPVGPLSGKTGVGVLAWLIAWAVLASAYRGKDVDFGKITRWAWILIVLGLLFTFPPFYALFAG